MIQQIVIYEGQNGSTKLDVHLEAETVAFYDLDPILYAG